MTNVSSRPGRIEDARSKRVELTLAADPEMLVLARMTGAAVAAQAQFGYEQIEDVRLAVDELCIRLVHAVTGPARINVTFQWDDEGTLEVMGTFVPDDDPSANGQHPRDTRRDRSFELSERILDALVDDRGSDVVGGVHREWLCLRRKARSA
jgi:Histidine kinase-like ATPase domain